MRIAIIGAGLAGLATAQLLLKTGHRVTVFEENSIGKGTSGIAAGLLHTYVGAKSRLNKDGPEARKDSLELIEFVENVTAQKIALHTGILRVALDADQKDRFATCAEEYKDVEWFSPEKIHGMVPSLLPYPGIFIRSGITVDTVVYLQGLWTLCQNLGGEFQKRKVHSLGELDSYDKIVITSGATRPILSKELKFTPIKGQVLELKWPPHIAPLPFPINSHVYIVMGPNNESCIVGATFEREFLEEGPNQAKACQELLPKVGALIPELAHAEVIDCRAGIRAATPNRLPTVQRINARTYAFIGLGSRGLLYHVLYAKRLIQMMLDPYEN